MRILLIRTDRDGSVHFEVYGESQTYEMLRDIAAHLNTEGVTELRLIPGH